ncbi:MAG TPA: PhzF family phenazine biosynthesis protein [Gammaproteobacteria bacterium]|nr:PhzF family phenazine biosynthesis protein [Gammaproteobacteria bacterium]
MSKALSLFQVDAFTDRPFSGNPAAVCLLDRERDTDWLQAVAAEMNLSETAFLLEQADGFRLRWFTPTTEVDLCGHATLAAAHVLWEQCLLTPETTARFHTRSGLLRATHNNGMIELDFPATPAEPAPAPPGLLAALGLDKGNIYRSRFDYLVAVENEPAVRALQPDFSALGQIEARGIMVTARSDDPAYDFVSRFFAPAAGIDEDPVTGSAHCTLAPWWAPRLGKQSMTAYQASKRGGIIKVSLQDDRVRLGGRAVSIFCGELHA